MTTVPETVQDINGFTYTLTERIGQGGQGSVHREKTGKFLIKLVNRRDSESRERVRRKLERVKHLPLDNLPITQPHALLRPPYLGYVMEYLKDMEAISSLRYRQQEHTIEWYVKTGGISRRLAILWKLADVLSQLHAKGLVYGDLSPNNVFISSTPEQSEVFLIDVDNLTYENNATESPFTRKYVAPEIFAGKQGYDTLTDSFSFAIMTYEILCQAHPLIGTMVEEGEPELEDQALRGELPWVGHSTDDQNKTHYGYPSDIILNSALLKLFQRTFEDGLNNRRKRPGVGEWADELFRASLSLVTCAKCGFSYDVIHKQCPNCNTLMPEVYQFNVQYWVIGSGTPQKRLLLSGVLSIPGQLTVTKRMMCYGSDGADEVLLEITTDSDKNLYVDIRSDINCWLTADWSATGPARKRSITTNRQRFTQSWQIDYGLYTESHRVITFALKKEKKI